jgi:hypothetical protein
VCLVSPVSVLHTISSTCSLKLWPFVETAPCTLGTILDKKLINDRLVDGMSLLVNFNYVSNWYSDDGFTISIKLIGLS